MSVRITHAVCGVVVTRGWLCGQAIAHLIHRDYDRIVNDFVTLQFIPRGAAPATRE